MNSQESLPRPTLLPTRILDKDLELSEEFSTSSTKNDKNHGFDTFDEILDWFESKGIEAGNPASIHEEFSRKQK